MSRRILVVEDDAELSALLQRSLEKSGFDVLAALNGADGVRLAGREKPDLVVVDLAMPDMNGYEVCQVLRADPKLKNTPIVVTSGKTYPVDIKMAKAMGADLFFGKPYKVKDLAGWIERLLKDRRSIARSDGLTVGPPPAL